MDIIITLTDAEYKALAYVAIDPEEWIRNAATARAAAAIDEIFQIELANAISNPDSYSISTDKVAVVIGSTLPSAADRYAAELSSE